MVFSVVFMHPLVLGVSFVCACAFAFYLRRGKAVKFTLAFLLPVMVLAAVLNPAFNHRGATILFYLWTGNPVTLESIYYGVAGALMIGSVIQWFYCYNATMSSDKFLWLFGRPIPTVSLIISMVLRLMPRYITQTKLIASARSGLGRGVTTGSMAGRVRGGLTVFSTMTTWALESAVDTADSMVSRGYGTCRRTSYSNYRLARRDLLSLCFLALAALCCTVLVASGAVAISYFPVFEISGVLWGEVLLVLVWAAACIFPLALDLWEDAKWHSLRSKL